MMMPLFGQLTRSWWSVVSAVMWSPHFGCVFAASAPLSAMTPATAKANITASETSVAGAAWRRSSVGIPSSLCLAAQGVARVQAKLHPPAAERKLRFDPWRSWPPPALLPRPAAGIGAGGDRAAPWSRLLERDRVHRLRDLVDDQVGELGSLPAVEALSARAATPAPSRSASCHPVGVRAATCQPESNDRPSADQPDCAVAQLDRKRLQGYGAGSRLDDARKWPERTLRAAHHLAAADVIARGVPRALKASILGHPPLAQRGEEVTAAVRDRERLAGADTHGQVPCGVPSTTATWESPSSATATRRVADCSEVLTRRLSHTSEARFAYREGGIGG